MKTEEKKLEPMWIWAKLGFPEITLRHPLPTVVISRLNRIQSSRIGKHTRSNRLSRRLIPKLKVTMMELNEEKKKESCICAEVQG